MPQILSSNTSTEPNLNIDSDQAVPAKSSPERFPSAEHVTLPLSAAQLIGLTASFAP
jgi:hypothetical protein